MVKIGPVLIGIGVLYIVVIIYTDFIESTNGYIIFSRQIWMTDPIRMLQTIAFPSIGLALLLAGIIRMALAKRNRQKLCRFCKQDNADENGVFCEPCKETISRIVANDLNINPTGNKLLP